MDSTCRMNNVKEGCQLLDGFALVVQATLALTVLFLLLWKRKREKPKRPFFTWSLDVSKQFVGASVVHCLNIQVSYLSISSNSDNSNNDSSNMCVWYLASILYDTTIGLALLYTWLRCLTWTLATWCDLHIPNDYGQAPFREQMKRWSQQTSVFVMAEILMKLCQFWCFHHIPWFFLFGQWLLDWTRDNYHHQVILVMFIYPLLMNAIQFWMIDTMLTFHRRFLKSSCGQTTTDATTTKESLLPSSYPYQIYSDDGYDFSIPSSSPLLHHVLVQNATYLDEYTPLLPH
ncbi:vacuolar membrane protein-domain-containing protein [Halteromyces radiatus]|uniref:vacuolar membrane protein-domain-containing protein n=1 Tax=Halteromyces radiatus TaxID=101107 RepID=UPI00222081EA|nr:vacuolar membrane protein-domain-containing protein [Halteromyces radiatus]KAI8092983.1 vacuolar membrane protein-domain-containing protein [Halteromyces radiatus]